MWQTVVLIQLEGAEFKYGVCQKIFSLLTLLISKSKWRPILFVLFHLQNEYTPKTCNIYHNDIVESTEEGIYQLEIYTYISTVYHKIEI